MKILVTGGNTEVPIDRVRRITNVFRGSTSIAISEAGVRRGHEVTLIGNPRMETRYLSERPSSKLPTILEYRTYDELFSAMEKEIRFGNYDAVIHSAAVSDYRSVGVYAPMAPCRRDDDNDGILADMRLRRVPSDRKVSSSHDDLFIRLAPTQKIVDMVRGEWGFEKILVKFKLQVDMSDEELRRVAFASMEASDADIIVANCLEWAKDRAIIMDRNSGPIGVDVSRAHLASSLLDMIENRAVIVGAAS